ncbi:hypothetical protein HAX54_031030, partial [Datura stramonium]|nr:hypothetical protein [Datura stramonium]
LPSYWITKTAAAVGCPLQRDHIAAGGPPQQSERKLSSPPWETLVAIADLLQQKMDRYREPVAEYLFKSEFRDFHPIIIRHELWELQRDFSKAELFLLPKTLNILKALTKGKAPAE